MDLASTSGLDLDDPATTIERRRILARKKSLRAIYREWYRFLVGALPEGGGRVLELGSGGGFLAELVPDLVRSEVSPYPWVDLAMDGQELPVRDGALKGIVMTNVLHHIPRPGRFFEEAARCLRPGGVIAMIEPWHTPWSSFVYRRLHHEPFLPDVPDWIAPAGGPLSGANGALPWIILARDRQRFLREYPHLEIRRIEPLMPVSYLLSGGISRRAFVPAAVVSACIRAERAFGGLARSQAMFAAILIERRRAI